MIARASLPEDGPLPITDTTTFDALDLVNMAPGESDVAVGAGAAVSSFNGNLQVSVPMSSALPQDGKLPSLAFGLTYNSNNVRQYRYRDTSGYPVALSGRSWVGLGWTGHLGRIYRMPKYTERSANSWDYEDYSLVFEFPDGSLNQSVRNAQPILRWQKFRDCVNVGDDDDCGVCILHPDTTCCQDRYDECGARGSDLIGRYDVTFPDGTVYRLEKIIPFNPQGGPWGGWISLHDRAGYYTTKITDVSGNSITIDYARSWPFPEAITAIHSTQHPEMDLTTTRCVAQDPDPTRCPAGTEGMLKEVQSVSFQGWRSSPQRMKFQLSYAIRSLVSGGQTVSVPVLTDVAIVGTNQESGGTTHFQYGEGLGSTLGNVYQLLDQIRTPLGAVFQFVYDSWRSGSRLVGSNTWHRYPLGIVRETVYPEGLGANDNPSGKPFFERKWNRDFSAVSCSPEQDGTNLFEQIEPDGRRMTYTVQGDPCARPYPVNRGPIGVPDTIVTYQGTPGVSLRTTKNNYDYTYDSSGNVVQQILQSTDTVFEDDKYTCFEAPTGSPATRKITRAGANRNTSNRWDSSTLSSADYMPTRNGAPVSRTTRTTFASAPFCTGQTQVIGLTTERAIYEGTGQTRFEENFVYDCKGEIWTSRVKDEWTAAGTGTNLGSDGDDLVKTFMYFSNGNLQQTVASGGGGYPDGNAANTYTTNTTWDKAQIKTQESPAAASYKLSDVTPDPGGRVWKSRDPNGLETTFDYDALGRLTEVDPPGSLEQKTRTIYDSDLHHVRVITSAGTETTFDANNSNQHYAEQELDQLGRVIQIWKAMPDGTKSTQVTRFDQLNRAIFVSEWLTQQDYAADLRSWSSDVDGNSSPEYTISNVPFRGAGSAARPWGTITFFGTPSATEPLNPLKATPDGLGRVQRVERADGSVIEYAYCGPHVQTTVKGIHTSLTSPETSDAVTRQYFDALGRLVLVDAPTGSADAEYSYDPRGNLAKVNLVTQLPSDPFTVWKTSGISAGQVRTFKYDAAGRLVSSQSPEKGTELHGAVDGSGNPTAAYYDPMGNSLVYVDALGQQRGYFFKTEYDGLGRPSIVKRVLGTPSSPATADVSRLGTDGDFPSGGGAWVEGTVTGNTFAPADSYWRVVTYSSIGCIQIPPGQSGSSTVLYFGNPSTCTYSDAPSGPQAIRHALNGVTKDDVLTFKLWRVVRQTAGNADSFQAYVVLQSAGNDVSARRIALKMDSAQVSFNRWQQTYEIRPGDLFTDGEWPESTSTQNLYLYLVFEKGDTSQSGIGSGVAVDDVFVGRRGVQLLATYGYDSDACATGTPPIGGEACSGGEEPSNRYKGQLTELQSYVGGRLLERYFPVHKGLNGRQSGEKHLIDWAGGGVFFDEFVTRVGYTSQGDVSSWTAPYQPGVDTARRYDYVYKRSFLDGLVDGTNNVPFVTGGVTPPNLSYTAAGNPSRIAFANGAETDYGFDAMQRPASVIVKGPAPGTSVQQTLWSTGTYAYDGGGNISAIGTQRFAYDLAQRLTRAQVLPQTTNSGETVPYDVTSSYDAFGNMSSQQWQHLNESPPSGFAFTLSYGASPSAVTNRIQGNSNFVYDPNGNLLRATGASSGQTSMLWDPWGRLSAFYTGTPEQQNRPTERYAYDAGGFRLVRWPESGDGRPLVTLKGATGKTTTEFVADPTSGHATMNRENVFVGNLLIAERHLSTSYPSLTANSTMAQSSAFGFAISGTVSGATYSVDIRTTQGFENHLGGVAPDANGVFWIPESALASGQRNWVSVRRESTAAEPYSNVVVVNYDVNLTSQAANQIRSISVSRSGTNFTVRWKVLQENGKKLRVYFHRTDTGATVLLTPQGLTSGTSQYVLPDQALASPCGYFDMTQTASNGSNETSASVAADLPPSGPMGASKILQPCGEVPPGPPPPPGIVLVTNFHHRDHLGSLRVLTDSEGWKFDAHDYYPFGREIAAIPGDGSVSRFTGHERDLQTGLDYMVMRSKSINYPFFSSPDLVDDVSFAVPHSWNKYAYVRANPLTWFDPTGLFYLNYSDADVGNGGGSYLPWDIDLQTGFPIGDNSFGGAATGAPADYIRILILGPCFTTEDADGVHTACPFDRYLYIDIGPAGGVTDVAAEFAKNVLTGNRGQGESLGDCLNRNLNVMTGGLHGKFGPQAILGTTGAAAYAAFAQFDAKSLGLPREGTTTLARAGAVYFGRVVGALAGGSLTFSQIRAVFVAGAAAPAAAAGIGIAYAGFGVGASVNCLGGLGQYLVPGL